MDDIVSPVITPVVESLKKHVDFLVSSTECVEDMKKKMEQLNVIGQDIRESGPVESHRKRKWLEDVKILNERSNLIEAAGRFNVAKRYKTGKQSYLILKEIEDLKTQTSETEFTNDQKSLAATSVPHDTHNSFKSRDLVFKDALKALQPNDESQKMIALCGMGGVGKTTMMEQLKKAVKDSNMFDWVVKVVIGENNDPISLQQAIAEYIDKDLTETKQDARADRLGLKFEEMSEDGKKKILVIMDDLWSEVDLKDVGLSPLPNGFKMLFTSRYKHVCTTMGVKPSSIFTLDVLNDAEAKSLFFETVDEGDNHPFQKTGEDIVKKCRGLPIAIVTIAKSLRGNIEEVWKRALSRLEEDNLEDLKAITRRVFEMSFENLKEDNDKAIFLLSGLFPDDFDIRIEDLLRYGWGLGLLKNVKNLGKARSDMTICISNLISANLLTKSENMGCVKMHDLVRAFVLSNFSKVKQASFINRDNISEEQLANESYDRILLKCAGMTKFPTDFDYPNLSVLMLMDGDKLLQFPEDIYKRMEKLEVVSYEKMHIPSHVLTFEHSKKLRTLCLRSCSFINDDISFIGSLSNMETLSFVDCKISRLPSTIGKLKKLKLLDLTGCVDLHIDDGVFKNLGSLEELYMRAYKYSRYLMFTEANCDELEKLSHRLFALELEFVENKAQVKNMSFENLKRFRISIGRKLPDLKYREDNLFRNTIQFAGDYNELLECKINDLFQKTEELHLQVNEMNRLEDVLMHHSFSNLTVLQVSKCADLTYLFTVDVAIGLQKLEQLTLSECPVMRTLIVENSRAGVIRFKKLSFLSLIGLPEMVSFWDNVIELPEMVELQLVGLPNFTGIYHECHNTSEMQSLFNQKVWIPKLENLYISRMENLKHIWPCETPEKNNVSMLRKIEVRECDNLVNLFPNNPFPLLNHLEELEVDNCGAIEVLFNMEFESVYGIGEYNNTSKLRSIRVSNLGKLKELWSMKGVNNGDIHINCFKAVESIEIENCSIFKNIFTPTVVNFELGALTRYAIYYTSEKSNSTLKGERSEIEIDDERVDEVMFEIDTQRPLLLPNLTVLGLHGLKEMTHVWKCNWNKFLHQPLQSPFQNLTNMNLKDCHKIKYLFSPLMAKSLSNLKYVFIQECDGIEEVVSWRDDEVEENTFASSHNNTILFPCLEKLVLRHLKLLHRVDGGDNKSRRDTNGSNITNTIHHQSQSGQVIGISWSLCQYSIKIVIQECHALSCLIPWYAVGQMNRLEELQILNCETMMEVFESETSTNNNNVDEGSAHSGARTTLTSETLKTIPSVHKLSNLKSVVIYKCNLVSHVFTFSTLESLKQLKELSVKNCKAIQVIVKEENVKSPKDMVFPCLETLVLDDLPSLKGFFLGTNDFRWPSLDNIVNSAKSTTVMISDCPQLVMFTSGESKTPKLKYIHTRLGKHSLECGLNFHGTLNEFQQTTFPNSSDLTVSNGMLWSFHNLIEINTEEYYIYVETVQHIIPSHALPQLQKLQKICIIRPSRVKEVFEVVALEGSDFNESQNVVQIPNLTHVELKYLHDLKYLWKSNRWIVLEFPNLTTVSINHCNSLEHVFTCSMVASLVQLQHLEISSCRKIEVIVKEEEETECDDKVNEIMLPRLKSLKLDYLPTLKGFCLGKEDFSWPSLDTIQIRNCRALKVFTKGYLSTPELKVIETDFGKWYVKTDLNSFINTKQQEGYQF